MAIACVDFVVSGDGVQYLISWTVMFWKADIGCSKLILVVHVAMLILG